MFENEELLSRKLVVYSLIFCIPAMNQEKMWKYNLSCKIQCVLCPDDVKKNFLWYENLAGILFYVLSGVGLASN